jgi:hypothetical protein
MIYCVLQDGQSVQVISRNQITDVAVDENFSGTSLFINNKKLEQEYIKAFG